MRVLIITVIISILFTAGIIFYAANNAKKPGSGPAAIEYAPDEPRNPLTKLVDSVVSVFKGEKKTTAPSPVPTSVPPLLVQNTTTKATAKEFQFIPEPTVRAQVVAQVNVQEYKTIMEEEDTDIRIVSQFKKTPTGMNKSVVTYKKDKEVSAMAMIDGTTYVKDYSTNTWWRKASPSSPDWQANDINNFSNLSIKNPGIAYTFIKEEKCGKAECLVYEENAKTGETSRREFSFDKETSLLYQESTGVKPFITVTTYEYSGITIAPPSKTKDVPQNASIFDYYKPISRYSIQNDK